jgi:hypothetical protein
VFRLDDLFDFLIVGNHVYILHPAGFERIAQIEKFAAEKAHAMTLALGATVKFIDFASLANYVARHRRGARIVAGLSSRRDLTKIKRSLFIKSAAQTGVELEKRGSKLAPAKGSEIACLELLDHRRYTTALQSGPKPAFIASSRRPIQS